MQPVEQVAQTPDVCVEYRWPREVNGDLGRQIIDLYNDSIRTENILGYTQPLSHAERRHVIERMDEAVRRGDKHFFGIHRGARLIGMALMTPNSLPNCRHIVEWSKGIIHSELRGHGVLKPAMLALARYCEEQGWAIITLDVRADSRSHTLWSALGFQEYGRLSDYARVDGVSHPGVFMFATTQGLIQTISGSGH